MLLTSPRVFIIGVGDIASATVQWGSNCAVHNLHPVNGDPVHSVTCEPVRKRLKMFLELQKQVEREKEWLANQPGFREDWETGCEWVSQLCRDWTNAYLKELQVDLNSDELFLHCAMRVWCAWAYHWKKVVELNAEHKCDGLEVAKMLREGIRPTNKEVQLGGNPLRDVVLAETCLTGHLTAVGRLRSDYEDVYKLESQRTLGKTAGSEEWGDLVSRLVVSSRGTKISRGKLATYFGYSSLATWLRQVIRHFLWDSYRRQRIRRLAERHIASESAISARASPIARLELPESLQKLRVIISRAFAKLPPREKLILFLNCRQKYPNQAIARLLGRSPGQVSRLRAKAIDHLRQRLHDELERQRNESDFFTPWEEEAWAEDPATFASFLLRGLNEAMSESEFETPNQSILELENSTMSSAQSLNIHKLLLSPLHENSAQSVSQSLKALRQKDVHPPALDLLLTQSVAVVTVGSDPVQFFEQLRSLDPHDRPSIVCVDGRMESIAHVIAWLQEFDAVIYEQFDSPSTDAYEPLRVVFAIEKSSADVRANWHTRPDIDWVETEDRGTDVSELYRSLLQKDFELLLRPTLPGSPSNKPADDVVNTEKSMPKAERARWQSLVKAIESWPDENDSEVGS